VGRRGAVALVLVLAGVGAASCASASGPDRGASVGVVTTVSDDRFCVGRSNGDGDCYEAEAATLSSVRVGDCVAVSWLEPKDGTPGPTRQIDVRPVDQDDDGC
jgi:ABC-type sugar transport system substrate-binding protein